MELYTSKEKNQLGLVQSVKKIKTRLPIDVDTSKQMCPISIIDKELLPYGGKVQKRIITNLENIFFNNTMRKHGNPVGHAKDLEHDFKVNGFRYTERPIVVVKFKTTGGHIYQALSGHNRVDALRNMGETAYIVDVVEFENDLGMSEYADRTNDEHPPAIRGTKADLINRLTKDCDLNLLERTFEAVQESLVRRAPSLSSKKKERETIVNEVIARIQPYEDFRTYYSDVRSGEKDYPNTTGTAGVKFGIPYFTDKNKKITELGYIRKSFSKSTAGDLRKTLVKYEGQPVYLTFYVEAPKDGPESLKIQRQQLLDEMHRWIEDEKRYTAAKLGVGPSDPIMDKFNISKTFIVAGFLPQDITPDPTKGGLPKEETLVDVEGNPVSNWRKGIKIKTK